MPNLTPNINLEKPLQTEFYNVDVFNANSDKIDASLNTTNENLNIVTNNLQQHISNDQKSIIIKRNVVILSSGWVNNTSVSGYYIYDILDTDISVNTIVDVNIQLSDLANSDAIKSASLSSNGRVRLFSDEPIINNITADLKLIRELGAV